MARSTYDDYWSIRIQCTECGHRARRNRGEGDPPFGYEPPPTVRDVCLSCSMSGGPPYLMVRTLHFVDFATPDELEDDQAIS